jgi:hypothetical protein
MKIQQPPVSHECIDGEVVIINMQSGSYYSLLDFGAAVWQAIVAGTAQEALLARVAASYPQEEHAREETAAFLTALERDGLVDLSAAPESMSEAPLPATYATPRLETFTDLQDLLMLDPIHEVDAAGWPHKS